MSHRVIRLTMLALLLVGLWHDGYRQARAATETAAASGIPGITAENLPRVDSSTSTDPLAQLLLCRALRLPGELRRLPYAFYSGEAVFLTFPVQASAAQIEQFTRAWRRQGHSGTHGAYMTLINGQSDLILVAREPSADELKEAQARKVGLDVRPLALDAFVFLINTENPLTALTLDQIRDVYTGKITSWRAVGGKDTPIRAYTRDRNSGSEELMEKLVLQGRKSIEGGDRMISTMGGVIEAVSRNPDAIAYSVFYYENVMNPHPKNKLLGINGVVPSAETIANRQYPLVAPVYVATRADVKADSPTAKLRDWLLGEDGQRLVAESGYVPIRP